MQLVFSIGKNDLIRQTYRGSGKGGQHRNKVETAVRFIHKPSGAVGCAEDSRSQHQNERAAFERMANTKEFKRWVKIEAARRMGKRVLETEEQIRARVDRQVDEGLKNGQVQVEYGPFEAA